MIQITRSLARTFRAVLRRAFPPSARTVSHVTFSARPEQLVLFCQSGGLAVAYRHSGHYTPITMALTSNCLKDIEGNKDTLVVLEPDKDKGCRVRWEENGVPCGRCYETVDPSSLPSLPAEPTDYSPPGPAFLEAFHQASQVAATEAARFALGDVQLRASGAVVGTDGRQLLIWRGFSFPWQDNLLVPRSTLFGSEELQRQGDLALGRVEGHVVVKTGPWLVWLPINTEGRYPQVEEVIPRTPATCFRLSPQDAAFLRRALPRLPAGDEDNEPITLEVNGQVRVRARDTAQSQGVEVLLTGSEVTGPPLRLGMGRKFLARALALGLKEFQAARSDTALQGKDEGKIYVWMPLPNSLESSDQDAQITSPAGTAESPSPLRVRNTLPDTTPDTQTERSHMSLRTPAKQNRSTEIQPQGNGDRPEGGKGTNGTASDLIEEVQALQGALRDALARTVRLAQSLKHQRKQNRLMRVTLAALRQFQVAE